MKSLFRKSFKNVIFPTTFVKNTIRQCSTLEQASQSGEFTLQQPQTSQRVLKVAIVGLPNAGKSTFINNLMDRKVCATSCKVHTTRKKAQAIFTEQDSQIIFLDTPGLVTIHEQKKYNLEKTFLRDGNSSMYSADTIGVIHDVGDLWCREKLDVKIIRFLEKFQKKPSFLVLNKIDVLQSKRKLLEITRLITMNCLNGKPISQEKGIQVPNDNYGWPYFSEVFMVSSLTGDGLNQVKQYLVKAAKPGTWEYPVEQYSDQKPENLIVNTVKATLLDFLPQEIPYQLQAELELYEQAEGTVNTVVIVHCKSERSAKFIAGVGNGRLKLITEQIQKDLEDVFQQYVRVRIILKHAPTNKR